MRLQVGFIFILKQVISIYTKAGNYKVDCFYRSIQKIKG